MKHLRTSYFIAANTAILLWLVLFGTHVGMKTYDRAVRAFMTPELSEAVARNYAHMSAADRDELLRETYELRFRYEPVVGFIHRAMTSRFLNIDTHGIRANGKTHRDITAMQGAIWFLGGSTTLGFGVADHETIPAQLELVVRRPVVNLGVSNYAGIEENQLLNHYLRIGYRPAQAIFLDGINEACEPDLYSEEMNVLVDKAQRGYSWEFAEPVTYASARIARTLKRLMGALDQADVQGLTCERDGRQNELRTIHARTLAERDSLCRLYEIECRTLVQPFAGLHGRHDDAEYLAGPFSKEQRDLFNHLEANWLAAGAIFVTDALDQHDRHAFVDEVHYSADASRIIAEMIASRLTVSLAGKGR